MPEVIEHTRDGHWVAVRVPQTGEEGCICGNSLTAELTAHAPGATLPAAILSGRQE